MKEYDKDNNERLDKERLDKERLDKDHIDTRHHAKDSILYLTEWGIINKETNDFLHPEDKVTTEQFVTMILRSSKGDVEPTRDNWPLGYLDYALYRGIIEDYDITNSNNPIERRSAARIIHEALLMEFLERDEEQWSAAEKLVDLYSCRTCVMHIAQVYVKGIMFARKENLFDLEGHLTIYEAADIVVRVLDKNKRIPPMKCKDAKSKLIQPEKAWEIMATDHKSILVDVRTYEKFKQWHMEGSICLPLHNLVNNPFSVCVSKETPIILYCQKGYKSSLAAQALIDVGYSKVYTIPGIEQYEYS